MIYVKPRLIGAPPSPGRTWTLFDSGVNRVTRSAAGRSRFSSGNVVGNVVLFPRGSCTPGVDVFPPDRSVTPRLCRPGGPSVCGGPLASRKNRRDRVNRGEARQGPVPNPSEHSEKFFENFSQFLGSFLEEFLLRFGYLTRGGEWLDDSNIVIYFLKVTRTYIRIGLYIFFKFDSLYLFHKNLKLL